jgi:AcrR family transcriptional regulator
MKLESALGLRETNKIEKLQRIRDATKALFIQKGFDDTTTREIALRANVGIGTVFTYADNKRDLLFLIANDDLDRMAAKGEAACRADVSCLENLIQFFSQHYEFFAKQPEISRMMLREMTFYDSGRQAQQFQMIRERNIRTVARIAKIGIDNRELRTSESPENLGWLAFCIFQVELRQWLKAERPSVAVGIKRLVNALRLCIKGWDPTAAAFRRSAAKPRIARGPK